MAEQVEAELVRRHRSAVFTVVAMFALTVLLVLVAYAGLFPPLPASLHIPIVQGALWFSILFFGLGAIALRRARFAAVRLQAIADLRGPSGLLATLQRTTRLVAWCGGACALAGFLLTALSNDISYTLKAAVVAVAILLYGYPRRAAWQRVVEATHQPGGLTTPAPPAKGTHA